MPRLADRCPEAFLLRCFAGFCFTTATERRFSETRLPSIAAVYESCLPAATSQAVSRSRSSGNCVQAQLNGWAATYACLTRAAADPRQVFHNLMYVRYPFSDEKRHGACNVSTSSAPRAPLFLRHSPRRNPERFWMPENQIVSRQKEAGCD